VGELGIVVVEVVVVGMVVVEVVVVGRVVVVDMVVVVGMAVVEAVVVGMVVVGDILQYLLENLENHLLHQVDIVHQLHPRDTDEHQSKK